MVDRRPHKYPRTPIAGARTGEIVKIVGWVRASAAAFISPLTRAICVCYVTRVDPYRPWYDQAPIVERRWQDIYVDDDSGSALVRLDRAEVRLGSMSDPWEVEQVEMPESWGRGIASEARMELIQSFLTAHGVPLFNRPPTPSERALGIRQLPPSRRKARFREDVLREGTKVAVLGTAFREPDPTAPLIDQRRPAFRLVVGAAPHGVIVSNAPDDWS